LWRALCLRPELAPFGCVWNSISLALCLRPELDHVAELAHETKWSIPPSKITPRPAANSGKTGHTRTSLNATLQRAPPLTETAARDAFKNTKKGSIEEAEKILDLMWRSERRMH
jgi:hypothetical protein